MWPDTGFAPPRGSFERPVDIPVHGPLVTPTLNVTVACEWTPYIRGALQQLLLQEWAFQLIDQFPECGGTPPPFSCPFDFQTLTGGADGYVHVPQAPFVPDIGIYTPLLGWVSNASQAAGNEQQGVDIHKVFGGPVVINNAEMIYNTHQG